MSRTHKATAEQPRVLAYCAWQDRSTTAEKRAAEFRAHMRRVSVPCGVDPRADWRGMIHARAAGAIRHLIGVLT